MLICWDTRFLCAFCYCFVIVVFYQYKQQQQQQQQPLGAIKCGKCGKPNLAELCSVRACTNFVNFVKKNRTRIRHWGNYIAKICNFQGLL